MNRGLGYSVKTIGSCGSVWLRGCWIRLHSEDGILSNERKTKQDAWDIIVASSRCTECSPEGFEVMDMSPVGQNAVLPPMMPLAQQHQASQSLTVPLDGSLSLASDPAISTAQSPRRC
jgi:hypothetical protein